MFSRALRLPDTRPDRPAVDDRSIVAGPCRRARWMTVQPIVNVADGNFENTGELLLVHRHEGLDLDPAWSAETLAALARLRSHPANILTERDGQSVRLRHDGDESKTFFAPRPIAPRGDIDPLPA
ncbi:MAG: hypothetical protein GYA57_07635 [Myxococcales bacterium]|nr:hypothetical protein [Myxococcales bacterium]